MTLLRRALLYAGLTAAACLATLGDADAARAEPEAVDAAESDVEAPDVPRLDPVPPPTAAELEKSIADGVAFLVGYQNPNGSWGSPTRTKGLNIYAPVPGAHHAFRAAVTSLAVSALIETGDQTSEVQSAIDKGEKWLLENLGDVRRANGDALYNVWAHGYSIQALVRLLKRHPAEAPERVKIKELIELQFDLLTRYESVDGGWGYYDFDIQAKQPGGSSISFTNAAILIAFKEAQEAGFEPPQRLVDRAVAATKRQRLPDFSYLYGEYLKWQPRRGINRPGGSLGRSQACNLALREWGDEEVTLEVLRDWLDRLFARNGWLDIGRKRPIPHESWMQVAGYFYYFGHYYAARAIEALPEEQRGEYQAHMARTIMPKQETDGSWWDFPFYDYHQPYGTAFAVMTLVRCRAPASSSGAVPQPAD
jgi:hypothetical protein